MARVSSCERGAQTLMMSRGRSSRASLRQYKEQLGALQIALEAGERAGDADGTAVIRSLVESVTVYRDKTRDDGISIEIVGRLNSLLGEKAYPNGVCFGMVAGEGLEPPSHNKSLILLAIISKSITPEDIANLPLCVASRKLVEVRQAANLAKLRCFHSCNCIGCDAFGLGP
jgi:hypothetical protein